MKILNKALLTLVLTILFAYNVHGQSTDKNQSNPVHTKDNQNYAMLIRNMNHLNAAIKTVQMLEDDGRTADQFEVIICGKSVTKLSDHTDLIDRASETGITLSACGMSLNKFSVEKEELPQGVDLVPNGLLRMFDLQEKGYKTIAL